MTDKKEPEKKIILPFTPMGSQVGADPRDNPRWDGEKILPYEEFKKNPKQLSVDDFPELWT